MLIASAVFLLSCAPAYKPPDLSGYVWPKPPQKARIRLVKVIFTDLDIRKTSGAERLFGVSSSYIFRKPTGVVVDNEKNIYVSDSIGRKVRIINLEKGTVEDLFNPYGWKSPSGLALDNENGLLAATSGESILLFSLPDKRYRSSIGGFIRPVGLAFDSKRKILYVADTQKNEIYSYNYDGARIATIAKGGTAEGAVFFPIALAVDGDGNLFVLDSMNWRVQQFGPEGNFIKAFGEHGDRPGMFARPKGIAISQDNFLFVSDADHANFQIFDRNGKPHLIVGRPGKGFGQFLLPHGIFVGKDEDKIYVVDQVNRRLQIFQLYTDRYYEELQKDSLEKEGAKSKK